MVPDLQSKILKWLRNHTLISTLQKKLKFKANSTISCEDEVGTAVESVALMVSESDIPDPVAVKSVPPQRRTKSSIRISKDNKLISSSDDILSDNGMVMDRIKVDPICSREADNSSKSSISNAAEKVSHYIIFLILFFSHLILICFELFVSLFFIQRLCFVCWREKFNECLWIGIMHVGFIL